MNTQTAYARDGVNVALGDDFSAFAGRICRESFNNSPFVEVTDFSKGFFRGPRGITFKNLPEGWLMAPAADGIGTKVTLIDAAGNYQSAARNLIAMTASDITRWGGLPLVFVSVLDVRTLGKAGTPTNNAFRTIMQGLGNVARKQRVVIATGETAELGTCVGSENPNATTMFNWAGFMLGAYLPDRMITGDTLAPGQVVVALQEHSFRSNGYSTVRAALRSTFGEEWWKHPSAAEHIVDAARPSLLYDNFLTALNGWEHPIAKPRMKVHLLTHVTGGGIVGKFGEDMLFPRGLSASLNRLFPPPRIMRDVVKWRGMSEEEAYRTFNCGNGMLAVIDSDSVGVFVESAKQYGIAARACGVIEKARGVPQLYIRSGYTNTEEDLVFFAPTIKA